MNDLEDLAGAVKNRPTPRPRDGGAARFLGFGFLLFGVAVAAWIGGRWWEGRQQQEAIRAALAAFAETTAPQPPIPFSVLPQQDSSNGALVSLGWVLTNIEQRPLVVKACIINGESPAPVGMLEGSALFVDPNRTYPVTLGIGETFTIFGYRMNAPTSNYAKEVVFIDIDTNRGKFRYRPPLGIEPLPG